MYLLFADVVHSDQVREEDVFVALTDDVRRQRGRLHEVRDE